MAITPHPLIGFASEYMRWKALLRDFPLDGVLSMTTHDSPGEWNQLVGVVGWPS
jgi:hypothetical protein